jgi:hypothetical protein
MSTPINDGGPAFPISEHGLQGYNGMSLRDWFAGQALAGGLDCRTTIGTAELAYEIADAMLIQREVQP